MHPPKKIGNILSSTRPDSLSHCVVKPRSVSTVMARKYNTSMTANIFSAGYSGCDSANITLEGHFNILSLCLYNHELHSYFGRGDIRALANAKVEQRKITPDLRDQWDNESRKKFDGKEEQMSLVKRGATFVSTFNAIAIQQAFATNDNKIRAIVKVQRRRGNGDEDEEEVDTYIGRSWSPVIGIGQVEDPHKYGAMMKGIKPYMGRNGNATMMLWTLVGMVSACNPLHYAIDQRVVGHHYNNYSGHLLAHINTQYMKHCVSTCPNKSPFSGSRSSSFLLSKLENSMPRNMILGDWDDGEERFFRFGLAYMESIFPSWEYPNIRVLPNIDLVLNDTAGSYSADLDVFITVSKSRPSGEANFCLDGKKFEAKVVIALDPEDNRGNATYTPNHYSGIRFARHGGGYSNWWMQKRSRSRRFKQMMTQCQCVEHRIPMVADPYPEEIPESSFYYVCVFAKDVEPEAEDYRLDMFQSVGAQTSVLCGCMSANPLIVCGRRKEHRRRCMSTGCNAREKYCCSNYGCRSRLCQKCFDSKLNEGGTVIVSPPIAAEDDFSTANNASDGAFEDSDEEEEDDDEDYPLDGDVFRGGGDGGSGEEDDDVEDYLLDSDEYSDMEEDIDAEDDINGSWDEVEEEEEDLEEDEEEEDEVEYADSGEEDILDDIVLLGEDEIESFADTGIGVADPDDAYDNVVSTQNFRFLGTACLFIFNQTTNSRRLFCH